MAITLVLVLVGFVWGRVRYDMVALGALIFLAAVDIVPREVAFLGFGHPAVITVAAMLVISRGLENSGVVDVIARQLNRFGKRPESLVGSHAVVVAGASGFMNNVGALALLMPVAIRVSRRAGQPAGLVLMPLAFASLLGGMVTMIGTPPNIVIASAREGGFRMFDFAPVGLAVAFAGIAFLALIGWRLIPRRGGGEDAAAFDIEAYLTEVIVPAESGAIGRTVSEVEGAGGGEVRVLALLRGERRIPAPSRFYVLAEGDVLVVEADADDLTEMLKETGLVIVAAHAVAEAAEQAAAAAEEAAADGVPTDVGLSPDDGATPRLAPSEEPSAVAVARQADDAAEQEASLPERRTLLDSDDIVLVEAVVRPESLLAGRSAAGIRLREQHQLNLLGVARQGGTVHQRLDQFRMRGGDVLLLQAPTEGLSATMNTLGLLPLAERGLRFNSEPRVLIAIAIAGLALVATVMSVVPVAVAATFAAVAMGAAGLIRLNEAYEAIDWPILVLLGAMLPVGATLESTGAADRVASALLVVSDGLPLVLVIALLLVVTMTLSDIVNNVAAAVLLIPIAVALALGLDASPDAFLMAVAVGASSAFLTPIGHQSNVLVMGPGGYQFSDYWRVGLPLELLIVTVAAPMITLVWA